MPVNNTAKPVWSHWAGIFADVGETSGWIWHLTATTALTLGKAEVKSEDFELQTWNVLDHLDMFLRGIAREWLEAYSFQKLTEQTSGSDIDDDDGNGNGAELLTVH